MDKESFTLCETVHAGDFYQTLVASPGVSPSGTFNFA